MSGHAPTPQIDPALLRDLEVTAPVLVTQTHIATIWRVRRSGGSNAALKIYHDPSLANEGPGLELLRGWDGRAAARLYTISGPAVLLEWLDGPSLGDDLRRGQRLQADAELGNVAASLHCHDVPHSDSYPHLAKWFRALFDLKFETTCDPKDVAAFTDALGFAHELINTQDRVRPLHGDLHHDNVRAGARGHCAFDPKGVLGEPAYELANAFRNPKGAGKVIRQPEVIETRADLWSAALGVERTRLLKWAAAKCALSIAWRSDDIFMGDPETDLLHRLLQHAE